MSVTARSFSWCSAALSHVGNVRRVNEDACAEIPERGLWVVADGMGGHHAGDVASRRVVDAVRAVGAHGSPAALIDELEDRLVAVNDELVGAGAAGQQGVTMGSTVVLLAAFDRWAMLAWAGDSRVYRHREGRFRQLTRDHSQIEEMIGSGALQREEAGAHPLANVITRAVGGAQELCLDLELVGLQDGDRYLLCTDGLFKDLDDAEIASLSGGGDAGEACERLIAAALEREAGDNITVLVIDFRAGHE